MTPEDFLSRLDAVKRRGRNNWVSLCPVEAHQDRTPSLAIAEGERGILVKCWGGCTLAEICEACGIRQRDLFFDELATDPQARRAATLQRESQRREREQEALRLGNLIDACKAAERYLNSRQPVDINSWSDDLLNRELNLIADAFRALEADPYATH